MNFQDFFFEANAKRNVMNLTELRDQAENTMQGVSVGVGTG